MTKAIIHTATRIVRRVTTDPEHVVAPDETAVEVPDTIDLAGGPWILAVDGSLVTPTQAEIDAANTPPVPPEIAAVLEGCAGVLADPEAQPFTKLLAQGVMVIYTPKPRREV